MQPIWDAINKFDPQLFIWLGDNVYGDNKRPFRIFGKERTIGPWKNVPRFFPSTEEELRRRYEMAKSNPGYAKLREKAQVLHPSLSVICQILLSCVLASESFCIFGFVFMAPFCSLPII